MIESQSTAPNVLLVIVDQWSGTCLGTIGHPSIQTPTLDQLARNGVLLHTCIFGEPDLYTGPSISVYRLVSPVSR